MILVDTSVWIDHLRLKDDHLVSALLAGYVLIHPWVIGELACGTLKDRGHVLELLRSLPASPVALENEVLFFIEQNNLMGKGIGYVDIHLLASTQLAGARLWTRDKRLIVVANDSNSEHSSSIYKSISC